MYIAFTGDRLPLYLTGKPKHCLKPARQIIRVMKLTAILLTVFFLQVRADGLSQTVTFSGSNVPLEKVMNAIKEQTGYIFFYKENIWSVARPVDLNVRGAKLEEVLNLVFKQQPLNYTIEETTIIISKATAPVGSPQPINPPAAPRAVLKGRVLTKEKEPLISANVLNKRTGKGTTTDVNGYFTLTDVNLEDLLIISYTGYVSQSINVNELTPLVVVLEAAANELDQVVMQGYGQTTRRFSTGNIAKVTSEEIVKQPVLNPLQALQGRVAGLVITQTSGFGSAPMKVEIRGRSNINDRFTSEPLYIIDGVPLTVMELGGNSAYSSGSSGFLQNSMGTPAGGQSPFFSINPQDIESIEVLKDADATAIYGSRAANGVILITTKKGKAGQTKFNINVNQGITMVTRKWDMLNTRQYVQLRNEAFQNDGTVPDPSNAYDLLSWDTTRYFDWQKYVWGQTGNATDAQMSLSGGNNQTTFRIGAGYNRRTDITSFSGADQRASLSFGLNFKSSNNKFHLSFNNAYSFAKSNMISLSGSNLVLLSPNTPSIYDSVGQLNYKGWQPADYPLASLFQPYTSKTDFLNSNLVLNYELTKGLTLRSSFGYNATNIKQTFLTTIFSQDASLNPPPTGTAQFGNNIIKNWIIEPQIEYSRWISKGKFNVIVGTSMQSNTTEGLSVTGNGYSSDLLLNTISNALSKDATELYGQYKYAALFGRVTYNWNSKYIVNLSGRRDGSSRFGEGKQFGNFGAIGAAWIFSEEPVLKKALPFLSFGKLRGSYGTTGSDAVGEYQYLTRWSSNGTVPYLGSTSLIPLQHANDQYHWQVNKKLEAAVDLGFLNDRVSLSIAWYRNRCNDQLVKFPIAAYTGFNSVTANSPAFVQNVGWEASLMARVITTKSFNWTVTFNSGINRNKLLSYPNIELSPYANTLVVGKPLNIQKVLHYTGVDPQTGLYTFEDKVKDGTITISGGPDDDRYWLEMNPQFTGGLGSNMTYKNFELSLFFNIVKQKGTNALYSFGANPGTINNASLYVFEHMWRKPGDASEFAKATTGFGDDSYSNFSNSDGKITDASYIRLTNLAFSYSLPSKLVKKAKLDNIQLRITAQNLFVLTHYKGLDPETQNFGGMPPAKIITGGLSINF